MRKPPEFIRGMQRVRGRRAQLVLEREMHLQPGDSYETVIRNGRVIGVAVYRAGFFRRLWVRLGRRG